MVSMIVNGLNESFGISTKYKEITKLKNLIESLKKKFKIKGKSGELPKDYLDYSLIYVNLDLVDELL